MRKDELTNRIGLAHLNLSVPASDVSVRQDKKLISVTINSAPDAKMPRKRKGSVDSGSAAKKKQNRKRTVDSGSGSNSGQKRQQFPEVITLDGEGDPTSQVLNKSSIDRPSAPYPIPRDPSKVQMEEESVSVDKITAIVRQVSLHSLILTKNGPYTVPNELTARRL